MIELRKIDPAKNMRRFYRLSVEPTLFGDFALVREWGRVGAKRGRIKEEWHNTALDADAALARALKRRVARGYAPDRRD
jgi:predicted DNA-binding WGR domain protein